MIRAFGTTGIDGAGELAARDRQVLATLVVTSGHDCPTDRIAAALYGDEPPPTWRKIVQGSIVHLRRALGPKAIETTPDGYRLVFGDDLVDIRRFERLLGQAHDLHASGEAERAAVVLREALELSRGDPLADVDGWEPARAEAARLREMRLLAQDHLVESLLASGQHREVVALAAAFVEQEPLREQRWAALALAQYRTGRQAEALRSIARARHVLADQLGIDPSDELVQLERAMLAQDPALVSEAVDRVVASDVCPYRGLAGYDVGDADDFFGREATVAECVARLATTGFLAVAGPSGCGKSSLARAGLAPALARDDRRVVVVTPGPRPAAVLASVPRSAALVIDQLEELFTQCTDGTERARFVELLDARATSAPVVVTVRSDHLAEIAELPSLAARVESGLHLLRPMGTDDLRAAIEGPARRAGLILEPGLVEVLLRDATGQAGALPLLSHALTEVWARREGRVLTTAAYQAAGGVQGAVSQTAERTMEGMPPEGRRIARDLFLRLVSVSDGAPVRQRRPRDDLAVDGSHAEVLDALAGARLVTVDESTVQVAHEAIAVAWPRLQAWLDEDREGQRILQHLSSAASGWAACGRDEAELYRGGRLTTATDWVGASRPMLTATERAFLDASIAARQAVEEDLAARAREQARTHRRLQRSFVAVCVALVVALLAAGAAWVQRSQASEQRDQARAAEAAADASARELALTSVIARSEALRATKRDLAALLAVAAYGIDPRPETFGALLGTFTSTPSYLRTIRLDYTANFNTTTSGEILADGTTYAVTDEQQGVRLVDLAEGVQVGALPPVRDEPASDGYLALSPDGRHVALATWAPGGSGRLTMWDLASRERRFPDATLPFRPGSVAFSPDGELVAVSGGPDGETEVRAAADGSVVRAIPALPLPADALAPATARTAALAFIPDGSLAVTSRLGPLRIVDPRSGAELRRLDGPQETAAVSIALSPDGDVVFGSSNRGTVAWDLDAGALLWHRRATRPCGSLAVAEIIGALLCGWDDGSVKALDLSTGAWLEQRFDYQHGRVGELTLADDGRLLIEGGGPTLALWRLDGAGAVTRVLDGGPDIVPGRFDRQGRLIVGRQDPGRPPRQPRLVDPRTGQVLDPLDGIDSATPVPARPGWLAVVLRDGAGGFYDTDAHQRVPGIAIDMPFVPTGAEPVPDGLLVTGDGRVRGVDLSGRLVPPSVHTEGGLFGLAVSPKSDRLFTLEPRGLVPRRLSTGEPTGQAPLEGVHQVAATADLLLVARSDGRLAVLDAVTLEPSGQELPPATGLVGALVPSGDGTRVLVVGLDRTARLVDLGSRLPLGGPIDLGPGRAIARGVRTDATGALSLDGELLAVGTSHGVAVWDLRPDRLVAAACAVAGRDLTESEWRDHLAPLGAYREVCLA